MKTMGALLLFALSIGVLLLPTSREAWAGDENDDYELSFDTGSGSLPAIGGSTITVVSVLDTATTLKGWQWGVCHDPDFFEDLFEGDADTDADTTAADFADLDTTFASLFFFPGEGWNCGGLMNVITQAVLEIGVYDCYETVYTLKDGVAPDTETTLEYCGLGDPVVPVAVIETNTDITPVQLTGTITIEALPEDPFLRGDVNANGKVEAISDALVLLEWAFVDGDPPACMDAADIDDNGVVAPLLEAILFIDWSFGNGGLEPAAPGPDSCGEDPTEDEVNCETLADVCSPV